MIRYALMFVLAAGTVAAVGYQLPTRAEEKKSETPPVLTAEEKAVLDYEAAVQMTRTGRETKAPVLLLAAAKVIGSANVRKFDAKLNEKLPGEEYDPVAEAGKLLDEAVAMNPKDEPIKAIADRIRKEIAEVKRGEFIGGGKMRHGTFPEGDRVDTFRIHYRSGEHVRIFVNNHTNRGDLNVFVYDPHGRLIAHDTRADDDCRVHFYAAHHGTYQVVVRKHHGAHHKTIRYTITTT